MIIDGKTVAHERVAAMRSFLASQERAPLLVAIAVAPDAPTRQFLKIKERVAGEIGVHMETVMLDDGAPREAIEEAFVRALARADGIVLQLPLPEGAPLKELLAALPSDLDPDCLGVAAGELLRNDEHIILPPVIAAIAGLVRTHRIELREKRAVVVGQGKLVGAPASLWLERQGAEVTRLTRADSLAAVGEADILILGAGAPGLITPDMLKEGVVIFDAGTSEEGGKVVGDADPRCAERASLFTPVPGGIGPIAVAELFGNLLTLKFDYEAGT
jgi:methylenetetrahydrofolate dehydrogenase (NADP+) / methenyltetrahydrofolate cyclohydrolase